MNHFPARDGGEVQALVRSAFARLAHCRYLLLGISDRPRAASWIGQLLAQGLVKSAADVGPGTRAAGAVRGDRGDTSAERYFREAVQLAFTHPGLVSALPGAHPIAERFPFPTIFARGMAAPERAKLLGDDRGAAWKWNDAATPQGEVHLLVAHYRKDPFDDSGPVDPAQLAGHGLQVLQQIETCPYFIEKKVEPFGFADGISQPRVPGLHSDRSENTGEGTAQRRVSSGRKGGTDDAQRDPNAVPPGELLLGHPNVYGEKAYCPDVEGFASFASGRRFAENGSYVAVRQIWQDTAALKLFDPLLEHVKDTNPPTPFERAIGRRKSGAPILACPVGGKPDGNRFLFRIDDYEGFHCPRGAHIRRGNPRDALGWDSSSGVFASRLHRILRRGRVYRDVRTCEVDGRCDTAPLANCGQGLFFIALNADLERQFEFVQRQWLANPKFADLWHDSDGLGGGDFSMPGYMPVGTRLTGLPQFTQVIGGGFFFLPSLSALKFIARTDA